LRILVTGATGYIGGRLVPRLLHEGHQVRVLVRDARRVHGRAWADQVDVVTGDLLDRASLAAAFDGIQVAYYLVHSMGGREDFQSLDKQAAENFVACAGDIEKVIYLGGLVPQGEVISTHLSSRAQVGQILRDGLATTEFRAGPIIGSGSASFEMVRYLTERLPVMVAPKWIMNPVQPIAVRDVLSYLVTALERPALGVVNIGTDALTFKLMMHGYAQVRGLRRWIIPLPVLTPGLAARWVGLVTPIPNALAVPLIKGVIAPLVCDQRVAREQFPAIAPMPYHEAVSRALQRTAGGAIETRWSGAQTDAGFELVDREGLISEVRTVNVDAPLETVFKAYAGLGGERGWLVWNWAWTCRGLIDRIVGGPGLRRGRRDPDQLLPGESLDFWRVEAVESPNLLRLRAEMKVPGRAWLQFESAATDAGSQLTQTALFAPRGLPGTLYWYLLYPIHKRIFIDMVRAIAREAQRLHNQR
jgi:uncharacterized protein YbjT (DUF2867 family)